MVPSARATSLRHGAALAAVVVVASTTVVTAQEAVAPLFTPAQAARAVAQVAHTGTTAAAAPIDDDARFRIVEAAFLTAAGTDIAVSMYQIGRGAAREVGFGSWWQDSPVAFAVTKSALTAVVAYQLQRLHRTRPKTAFVVGIVGTSVEAMLAVHSARLAPIGR